ncbi:mitotic checkpoint protein Bub3 [Carpediemonas membranifera]|uniref:Mitotic checkpoint protein Bub3 n=1 Tax=Carpediemonas membranifera TaxID=201153 RepID=A0A8J6E182_9EUKA|nr:mitotic checkpoint protein Bub3 [Carpediemonas membranifera]|eukprot:KAG9393143.1 mitotic checkpoint protein Bub3 [Carpediemonas membranifera]
MELARTKGLITDISWGSDTALVASYYDSYLRIYNTEGTAPKEVYLDSPVLCCEYDRFCESPFIFTGLKNGSIIGIDPDTDERLQISDPFPAPVTRLICGNTHLWCASGNRLTAIDIRGENLPATLEFEDDIIDIDLSNNEGRMLVATKGRKVVVVDALAMLSVPNGGPPGSVIIKARESLLAHPTAAVKWLRGDEFFTVASIACRMAITTVSTKANKVAFRVHQDKTTTPPTDHIVYTIAVHPGGRLFLSGGGDRTVQVHSLSVIDSSKTSPLTPVPFSGAVVRLKFNPSGTRVAAACRPNMKGALTDSSLTVLDVDEVQLLE